MSTAFRISSLDRAALCPASIAESDGAPSIKSDASCLGDAFHDYMDLLVRGENPTVLDTARKHMVPEANLQELIELNDFNPAGGEGEREVSLHLGPDLPPIVGHVDWTRNSVILDYKTGHPPDHENDRPIRFWAQGHGYGLAIMDADQLDQATITRYWVRLGDEGFETATIDPDNAGAIREWITGLAKRAWRMWTGEETREYRPIESWDGCWGCAGKVNCPALRQKRQEALALSGLEDMPLSAETIPALWDHIQTVGGMDKGIKKIKKDLLTPYLEEHGPVPLSETVELRLVPHHSGSTFPAARKKENQ